MTGRAIVDYAEDGNASAFRDALYSDIMDRVQAHIEAKKQEIAQNLIAQEEDYDDEEEYVDDEESSEAFEEE